MSLVDSEFEYQRQQQEAKARAGKSTGDFNSEMERGAGGCLAIAFALSAIAVLIVTNIKFAIAAAVGFAFIRLAEDRKKASTQKYMTNAGWVILALTAVWVVIEKFPRPLPSIAASAIVSVEGASEYVLENGVFRVAEAAQNQNLPKITFNAGDNVKLINYKRKHAFFKIETPDGKKGKIHSRVHKAGGYVQVFEVDINDYALLPPKSFFYRVIDTDLSQPRPVLLQQGDYYPEGETNINFFRIEKIGKFKNKKQWEISSYIEGDSPVSTFRTEADGKKVKFGRRMFFNKNSPPVEVNGIKYNFSVTFGAREDNRQVFIITSPSSFVSEDGKVLFKRKKE